MEKIIMTIIGVIFIVISYLIGLNQNRKEKEYYQKGYQYYRNEYFHLKRENINGNEIKVGEYKTVVACPICYGRGFVPAGFYDSTGLTWVSTTTGNETCRSCGGKGYIKL